MRIKCLKGLLLSPFLLVYFSISATAQTFVYTDNNVGGANSVTGFSVAANGVLTNIGTFPTGGAGSGGALFAANRARTCRVGTRLYVTNDGSNSVSGFDINPFLGTLTLVPGSPFATGGLALGFGISLDCTPNGNFLIAANGGSDNITVFSVAGNGALTPVAGSPFAAGGGGPDGVKITPNGQFLSVALVSSDRIGMYSIAGTGVLTPVPGSPFASPAFGFAAGLDINCAGTFLYAAQANGDGTYVDVFSIAANGVLGLVQTSSNFGVGNNSNVGVLSPNDRFLFVSNQFSNSVTVFNVAANGTLSLLAGSPFFGTGDLPCGMATNAVGTLLFTANLVTSNITSYRIAANGALTLVGSFATGQLAGSGLESLAVFPGKSCPFFDVCLQDDSDPSIVFRGNSETGAYEFCCHGTLFTGTATVTKKGNTVTFEQNAPDRKMLAKYDGGVFRGSASIQSPLGTTRCTITDRDTRNNSCVCQ